MTRTLRPYQHEMVDYMTKHPRCMVFGFMGAGKTVATYTALDHLSLVEEVYPALVLAPKRVALAWPAEAAEWGHTQHLRVVAIAGTAEERLAAMCAPADIYTCSYDNLLWLREQLAGAWPYKTVVADECTRVRGFRTRQGAVRAAALAEVAFDPTRRFIGLTGTPCSNGIKNLWAIMWFIDQGERLGRSYTSFEQRWFHKGYDGFSIIPHKHSQGEIQEKLRDVCMTVDSKDYFNLADPIVTNIFVDMPAQARVHYDEIESDMFTQLESGEIEAFNAAAKIQKLLQAAGGALYLNGDNKEWQVIHDEKLEALESIVEDANGMPVLVAYQHKSDLARLKAWFPKGKELDAKPKTVKDFNAGKIPILFAHPASAGHGLNLQHGTNILVFFSLDWNLENHLQIIERIGPVRQMQAGLDRNVFIYRIMLRGSIDEDVLECLTSKRTVQEIFLAAMKKRKKK